MMVRKKKKKNSRVENNQNKDQKLEDNIVLLNNVVLHLKKIHKKKNQISIGKDKINKVFGNSLEPFEHLKHSKKRIHQRNLVVHFLRQWTHSPPKKNIRFRERMENTKEKMELKKTANKPEQQGYEHHLLPCGKLSIEPAHPNQTPQNKKLKKKECAKKVLFKTLQILMRKKIRKENGQIFFDETMNKYGKLRVSFWCPKTRLNERTQIFD